MTTETYIPADWSPTLLVVMQLCMALVTIIVFGLTIVMAYRASQATSAPRAASAGAAAGADETAATEPAAVHLDAA